MANKDLKRRKFRHTAKSEMGTLTTFVLFFLFESKYLDKASSSFDKFVF